jgi:cell division ATPase FtsA
MALLKGLDVNYETAEHIKHTKIRLDGHTPPDVTDDEHARYIDLIAKPLKQLIRDIRLTLHAHANRWQERADRVLLVGGSSQLPGLDTQLQQSVGLEVKPVRISAEGWTKMVLERDQERSMAMSTALGLTHIHGVKDGFNFRMGEFASESDFTILRAKAGWLLSMAALFLAAFIGQQVVTFQVLEANHAALVAQLETFSEDVLGEKRSDFKNVDKSLDKPPQDDTASVFPEMTAFKAFYAISEAQQSVNEMKRTDSEGVAPGPVTAGEPAQP